MPRILTNKYNLPQTIVDAMKYDTHVSGGTISVTELIDGPQIRILKKKYEYESDVTDNVHALMGTALHHVLERANISSVRKRAFILTAETLMLEAKKVKESAPDKEEHLKQVANWLFSVIPVLFPETNVRYIFEKTLRLEWGPHIISGTFDIYDKILKKLEDYKNCSVFQYLFPEARKKWEEQTNIYAYMLKKELGVEVQSISIIAIFKDWNRFGFMKDRNYPPRNIMEIPIRIMSDEEVEALIGEYIDLHVQAENGSIPLCSGTVRWAKSDSFAVKTKTAKKAIKVFDTMGMANQWCQENRHNYASELFIETRPGGSNRCENFCPVSKQCPQYALEKLRVIEISE